MRVAEHYATGVQRYLDLGKKVILVYPIPEAGWNVPELLAKLELRGAGGRDLATSYVEFQKRNKTTIDAQDSIQHPNLYRVKPHEILCDSYVKDRCANRVGGGVLYLDTNHVSNAGTELITSQIGKIVRQLSFTN